MRILNTAEVLTIFAAIGQFSNLRKNIIVLFMTLLYAANTYWLPSHIESADSELSLAPAGVDIADSEFSSVIPAGADDADVEYFLAPAWARAYTVKPGDICNSIGARHSAPTVVSSYIIFAYFTYYASALKYSYQIMRQNDAINSKCSNLGIGQVNLIHKNYASRRPNWNYYCRIFALDSGEKTAGKLIS